MLTLAQSWPLAKESLLKPKLAQITLGSKSPKPILTISCRCNTVIPGWEIYNRLIQFSIPKSKKLISSEGIHAKAVGQKRQRTSRNIVYAHLNQSSACFALTAQTHRVSTASHDLQVLAYTALLQTPAFAVPTAQRLPLLLKIFMNLPKVTQEYCLLCPAWSVGCSHLNPKEGPKQQRDNAIGSSVYKSTSRICLLHLKTIIKGMEENIHNSGGRTKGQQTNEEPTKDNDYHHPPSQQARHSLPRMLQHAKHEHPWTRKSDLFFFLAINQTSKLRITYK